MMNRELGLSEGPTENDRTRAESISQINL